MTCPPRKDEADWLVELTGQAGGEVGDFRSPVTATEFQARWRESEAGNAVVQASLAL